MTDYTPTTQEVRGKYATHQGARYRGQKYLDLRRAEFDRWLNEVKAEAWDEGFTDGINHDLGDWDNAPAIIKNPYREEKDA